MESTSHSPGTAGTHRGVLLAIAYVGFISLGLPDTLIGVAWPRVRDTFGLEQAAAALIFFGAGLSYFLSSLFTCKLLARLGVGLLLAGSSAVVALSNFGYATAPIWILFAFCSLLHGLGSGAIDAGLNHYVAHHFSARHMNWLHACYSLGATLGPLVMTAAIATAGWRAGYATVAAVLAILALLFMKTWRKWDRAGDARAEGPAQPAPATLSQTLREPIARIQVVLFFFYTGLEVTGGQWAFTVLTESRQVPAVTAGLWVTIYWASIAAGRVLFGFVAEAIGLDRLLRWCILAVVAGAGVFAANLADWLSLAALILVGFGLAPIYPCLMTRTPQRLGPARSAHAIGLQVSAAMIGAAVLPSTSGFLAQVFGLEVIPFAALTMAVAVLALHEAVLRQPSKEKSSAAA